MPTVRRETVQAVHHWNDKLFSLRTTRAEGFRFRNGEFVMLGLVLDGRNLLRAYSMASPNHAPYLEFLSIKVEGGALTSRLQHVSPGDEVLVTGKPVGTLVLDDLNPGRRLLLLATGTGLAPFLAVVQDPEVYEAFEEVVLVHGVRRVADLAYRTFLTGALPADEYLGELVRAQLRYVPIVSREPFPLRGRIPALLESGELFERHGLAPFDPQLDRAMICGSMPMLRDTERMLERLGARPSPQQGVRGDFVIERAFVDEQAIMGVA